MTWTREREVWFSSSSRDMEPRLAPSWRFRSSTAFKQHVIPAEGLTAGEFDRLMDAIGDPQLAREVREWFAPTERVVRNERGVFPS